MLTWTEVDAIVTAMHSHDGWGMSWRVMEIQRRSGWVVCVWQRDTKQRAEITSWEGWQLFQAQCLPQSATAGK